VNGLGDRARRSKQHIVGDDIGGFTGLPQSEKQVETQDCDQRRHHPCQELRAQTKTQVHD
jgi:hypothetical protein